MPIAPGYHLESQTRTGLGVGGLVIFGVPYAAGLIAAAASGFAKSSGWVALPIVGPFAAMGGRSIDCSFVGQTDLDLNEEEAACRESALAEARVVALLTISGLMQAAGAIIAAAGFATHDDYLIRNDLTPAPAPEPAVTLDGGYESGGVRLSAQLRF